MKRNKFIRDFKIYNFVMSNIWQLLTTLLIGFGIGWLLEKYIGSDKNLYMVFSIVIAILIGVGNFFFSLYKKMKQIQDSEAKNENVTYNKYDEEELGEQNDSD